MQSLLKLLGFLMLSGATWGSLATPLKSHFFLTSDGVELHYLEAGQAHQTIVFIPGWLMPAAIFENQLAELSKNYRVLALDPRSQGQSELTTKSHAPQRRIDDIREFLVAAKVEEFVLAGWSLGVLEVLDYLANHQPTGLKGLILIDNSVGEGRPPQPRGSNLRDSLNNPVKRETYLREFSQGMFKQPPPSDMMTAVLESVLRVPSPVALQLINQPYPREHWRDTLAKQLVPVLYAIRPRFKDQAESLLNKRPTELIEIQVFEIAGHALFVDDAGRFNSAVRTFCQKAFAR